MKKAWRPLPGWPILVGLAGLLLLSGCTHLPVSGQPAGQPPETSETASAPTRTPFQPLSASPTLPPSPKPEVTPTRPAQISVGLDASVPEELRRVVQDVAGDAQNAELHLGVDDGEARLQAIQWVYALVAPFPTVADGVSSSDLRAAWRGAGGGAFAGRPLLMEASTLAAFSALWGAPAAGAVRVLPAQQILDAAWAEQPAWAIVPFEAVEPRWKVLAVDGQSPLEKSFDLQQYPLTITFGLQGDAAQLEALRQKLGLSSGEQIFPATNRDPAKLTVLVMTGTTALTRATAYAMQQNGVDFPGKDIAAWLRGADLTHISNESSFTPDCPPPDPMQTSLRFCSSLSAIGLLESVGTQIVELTGNHVNDYGPEVLLNSIRLFRQLGWQYFGGGVNLEDARKPLLVENHGNRLAFIGCNPVGPVNAWATATQAGAAPCDLEWEAGEVTLLRSQGYLPIVTFQYNEYYQFLPSETQQRDFRKMAAAGAVIVSGSQAHFPQGMGFYQGAFIHYGLGNLFFDQMDYPKVGTRREFIDRHVFYDGRYLGVELLTAMLEDYARPRPMTLEERQTLLGDAFGASDWERHPHEPNP